MAIHLYTDGARYVIWTDCEPGHFHSGRCIGMGETLEAAVRRAVSELKADLAVVDILTEDDIVGEDEEV